MESKAPISHPDEWPVVSLKNICGKIGSGATPKGGKSSYLLERENYAFVRSQNVFDRYFSFDGLAYISDDQAEKLRNVELKPGDILLNITGDGVTFARACMVPMHVLPACVNQHVAIIRLDEEVADPGYVLSFLTLPAVKIYIESFNAGGSRRAITKGHIESFQLPLPPIDVQRYIAQVLQSLDDKIELNRQINATLESMAQALFKSWFVDFDPVIDNALAAGNPIPEPLQARAEKRAALLAAASAADTRNASATDNAHPTQTAPHTQPGTTAPATPLQPLPADLRALFPDSFVFNEEMGWVPEGWGVVPTEDVAQKIGMGPFGSNIKVSTFVEAGVPVISGKHLNNTLLTEGGHNYITEEHASRLKNSMVFPGDVIFTHAGNIGQVSLIAEGGQFEEYVISQRQFYLRPDLSVISPKYLVYFFRSNAGQHALLANASQVGVPSIARPSTHLKAIKVIAPSKTTQEKFDELCDGFLGRILLARKNIDALTKTRDALLPRLLTGRIQLPEAEKLVAEAL